MASFLPGEWDWMEKVGLGGMPAPSAVTAPIKAEGRLSGLARRFGETLFPMIGAEQMGMNPAQVMQAQRAARKQLGLGMLANVGTGRSFGEGLGGAMGLAQYGLQQGMDRQQAQYALEQRKAQQEREDAYRAERDAVWDERFALQQQQRVADQAAAQAQEERGRTELTAWQQAQINEGRADRAARASPAGGLGAPPSGYRWNPDGSLAAIPGGPQDPAAPVKAGGKLTEGEQRALSQVSRMNNAEAALQKSNYAPTGVGGAAAMWAAEAPGVGNIITSKKFQAYQQSAREWISGLLRYDSGAAVPETEFHRYFTTYFPQPGDSQQTIQQKNQSRQLAVQSMQMGLPQHGQARLDQGVPMPGGGTLHPRGSEPTGGADYDYVPGQGLMRAGR